MNIRLFSKHIFVPVAYAATGFISLVFALLIATSFLRTSKAQEPVPNPDPGAPVATPSASEVPTQLNTSSVDTGAGFLEPYLYDVREGRRNPFKSPPDIEVSGTAASGGLAGPTGPLERYEVDELKIIAIMWDVRKPRALIVDPNNEVHTAYKDERIGRKRGYIAVIRESEIVVVEPSSYSGETVYSTRILRLTE